MMRSHSCSVVSIRSSRDSTPTLLCRMSRPPQVATARSTIALHSAARVTSAANGCALPFSFSISLTVSCARPRSASTHSTLAPSRANRIAVALPLPRPGPRERAPVTIATLPLRRSASGLRRLLVFRFLAFCLLLFLFRLGLGRAALGAVHQRDERERRVIALAEAALEDAQVAAVALGVARAEVLEQLL